MAIAQAVHQMVTAVMQIGIYYVLGAVLVMGVWALALGTTKR